MAVDEFTHPVLLSLRDVALGFPEVVEGTSCVNRRFEAGKKGFLFLGEKDSTYRVMLKLSDSIERARKQSEKDQEAWKVGDNGWVTIELDNTKTPPKNLIEKWIDESYRTLVPKRLVTALDEA